MRKFPFKDDLLGFWVYEVIPETMRLALPKELYIGKNILYKVTIGTYTGLYISDIINRNNIETAKKLADLGRIYIANN